MPSKRNDNLDSADLARAKALADALRETHGVSDADDAPSGHGGCGRTSARRAHATRPTVTDKDVREFKQERLKFHRDVAAGAYDAYMVERGFTDEIVREYRALAEKQLRSYGIDEEFPLSDSEIRELLVDLKSYSILDEIDVNQCLAAAGDADAIAWLKEHQALMDKIHLGDLDADDDPLDERAAESDTRPRGETQRRKGRRRP